MKERNKKMNVKKNNKLILQNLLELIENYFHVNWSLKEVTKELFVSHLYKHKDEIDINDCDNFNSHLLVKCLHYGFFDLFEEVFNLYKNKINVNKQDKFGRTILMAMSKDNWHCFRNKFISLFEFYSNNININLQDNYGKTLLMYLLENKQYEVFDKLLDIYSNNININLVDEIGNDLLYYCLKESCSMKIDIFEKFLTLYKDKFGTSSINKNYFGCTPLMLLIKFSNFEKIKFFVSLFKKEIDINKQGEWGYTALMLCLKEGCYRVFEFLLDEFKDKIKINLEDCNGFSLLLNCIFFGFDNEFHKLIDLYKDKINIMKKNSNGYSILDILKKEGFYKEIKYLKKVYNILN